MKEEIVPAALPEAFLQRMRGLLGEEFEAFLESYEAERVQGLRLNTRKGELEKLYEQNRERFGLRPVPWCREGFYYRQDSRPGRHPLHEAGVYYIQEPSAMAAAVLLAPRPGERILDLCAAPGGKTTHLADLLEGSGLLVSNEIHPARARILSRNVERMGISNAVVVNEDSGRLADRLPEFFDGILVDAPCSGEGMFRKDEQARKEWSEENVASCAKRQKEILDNGAKLLRPGGRLVYSTCTFSPEEDEMQIQSFLERHPEFSLVRVSEEQRPPGLSPGMREASGRFLEEMEYTFRIWPHRAEGEGHYLALLQKKGDKERDTDTTEEKGIRLQRGKTATKAKGIKEPGWKDKKGRQLLREFAEDILERSEAAMPRKWEERLRLLGDQIYLVPEEMTELQGLRLLRPGLHIGTLKKNRFEPAHALALALNPCQVKRKICLEADGAKGAEYLAGNILPAERGLTGWVLVCIGGYPLGWGKAAGGMVKNHYPKGLRIQGMPGSAPELKEDNPHQN